MSASLAAMRVKLSATMLARQTSCLAAAELGSVPSPSPMVTFCGSIVPFQTSFGVHVVQSHEEETTASPFRSLHVDGERFGFSRDCSIAPPPLLSLNKRVR